MVESSLMEPVEGFELLTALDEEPEQAHILDRALHASRNLVMATRGYAELLQRDVSRHESSDWAGRIVRQLDRLSRLYDRIERLSGELPASSPVLPVDWPLRGAVRELAEREDLARRQVQVAFDLQICPSLKAHASDLQSALSALLENAIEASPEGGVVVARIEPDFAHVWRLSILDGGPGLPPLLDCNARRPFKSRKPGHVGLGLFLCRTLLSRHGLELHLENRVEGGVAAMVTPMSKSKGGLR